MIFLFTLIVSFCSIVYELLLAQTLSTTMGNTILRYSLTIGFYLASLGFGALYTHRARKQSGSLLSQLLWVECALSVIGTLSPALILIVDTLAHKIALSTGLSYQGWVLQLCLYVFNHGLIVVIGFLSGIELPLLMNWGEQQKERRGNRVLIVDYIGTLLGAILFPLLLLPVFGLFFIAHLTGFLNALVATLIMLLYRPLPDRGWGKGFVLGCTAIIFCFLLFSSSIGQLLQNIYFLGVQ